MGVVQPACDLVAMLGGERGRQPGVFGIRAGDSDLALARMYHGEYNWGINVVADQRLAEQHSGTRGVRSGGRSHFNR